jgi:probable HAF family extracellular repeat protein
MKNSRIVRLAMFAMVVFGGVETAFADPIYSFTTFNAPGATGFGTNAFGINDSGQIVGFFFDAGNTTTHGFLDTGGSFTTINAPGAIDTYAYGINDSGQIVGSFVDALGSHGFVDTGGSFTTLPRVATGINNSGQIVGSFGLYTGGSFTAINVPGASSTSASGINNSGQIVGSFNFPMGQGFLDMGGSFTTIDVPGFCCTFAQGINDDGQIVGWVGYPASPEMAFVATPVATPEPPSLLTLATCLVALFGIAWHRRQESVRARPLTVINPSYRPLRCC